MAYRSWGNIQPAHYFIFSSLLALTVLLLYAAQRKRALTVARLRAEIPREAMPLARTDMPRRMYQAMVNELVREHRIKASLVPESPGEGDNGWGRSAPDGPNLEGVHFKTSIAKSYLVLEEAASVPRPGTRHRDFRSVRDFMAYLQTEFPGIADDLAQDYIEQYERARFSPYPFDVNDYNRFMATFLEIVERIQ